MGLMDRMEEVEQRVRSMQIQILLLAVLTGIDVVLWFGVVTHRF
jgi:hypothetical protein